MKAKFEYVIFIKNGGFAVDGEVIVIGIAGGTGSGKTTITERIVRCFENEVSVIHHDSYYKAHHKMSYEERCRLNYDHPDAFDTAMLIEAVKELKAGRAVECPVYDYTIHDRSEITVTINPARVIIVEGILIFAEKELCELMDIKIFVDADADERILRRIIRDVRDRGRSLESVISQYLETVKPMHEEFVEPSKRNADIIIPRGGHNNVALEMVINRIRTQLHEGGVKIG